MLPEGKARAYSESVEVSKCPCSPGTAHDVRPSLPRAARTSVQLQPKHNLLHVEK